MPRRFCLVLAALFFSLTCGKDAAGPVLASRMYLTGPDTVYLGDSAQFQGGAVDAAGSPLPDRPVTWSSSDTTIASVTQSGIVKSRTLGAVTIQVSSDGKTAGRPLSVVLVPVFRVRVTGGQDSLFVGDSIQLTAAVTSQTGRAITDRVITWRSSDTAKATVSPSGFVRTLTPGSFAITARADTVTGGVFMNAQLRVAALLMPDSLTIGLHHSVRLIPDLRSGSGTHLSGRAVVWTSLNPTVLDVTQNGVLQLHDTGSSFVVVQNGSFSDSSYISVVLEPVVAISLSFISQGPFDDQTVEALEATAYDAFNLPTAAPISWSSSDTTVLNIAPSPNNSRRAVITGRHPGVVRFTATSGAVSASQSYTLTYPIVRFVANPDSVGVRVGESWPIAGDGVDRFGNRVSLSAVQEVIVADTTIAMGENWVYVRGIRPGRTIAEVRYVNATPDTVPVMVLPGNTPRLKWSYGAIEANAYSTTQVAVDLVDSTGAPLAQARDIRIASSDTSVAVATPALIIGAVTSELITVETKKRGLAVLTAGTDSQFTQLRVGVANVPPAGLELDAAPAALEKGSLLQLHATVRGADGIPHPYPVTWITSNPGVATVSTSGLVTAITEGPVSIRASSETTSDVAEITVVSANPPSVSSIGPTPLVPGATITISGTGFDSDIAQNAVLVDGIPTTVVQATTTELVVNLPTAKDWPCAFDHDARLLLTSGGRVGLDSAPLHVAISRAPLAVGDTIGLDGDEARCNELAPVGTYTSYVVLAENTDPGIPLTLGFQGIAASVQSTSAPVESRSAPTRAGTLQFSMDSLRNAARFHRRLLEQSQALSLRAGPAAPLLRAARQSQPLRSVTATINGVARVRVPKLEDPDFCASYRTIDARVVFTGPHVVILEDNAAPLAGTTDYYYSSLGLEFEGAMYPKLLANFGDPLAMDSLLDRDGRIAIILSPVVNTYGVGGFVVSCDFYPESVAPSSNTGEIFYAPVPLTPGNTFTGFSGPVWYWLTRSVVMHEAKHITAFAERLSRGATIEDPWLEESSAVLAEEMWARGVYFNTWKGDATYRATIYCDVRPTFQDCGSRPYSMFNAFAFLYDYIRQLDRRTPLGPTSYDDATFYGSGWSLLRWAIDQSNLTESDFLKQLVQEPALTGVANLEARAQRPFSQLLPNWAAALYYDSWALAPKASTWSMPSWKMDDIFSGMRQDFPSEFPEDHPVHGPEWTFGHPFEWKTVTLAPGGWALVTGDALPHVAPQLIEILSAGKPLPPSLHVQIIRVR